ncbi:O-antigen ligase family protein [Nonomuraea typhae]|uniref:O-antigen ligase family protein n=1 Tax=Nonomuraea typhae TaxID=2603600 RepID=A0ABW7YUB4_9ACTN
MLSLELRPSPPAAAGRPAWWSRPSVLAMLTVVLVCVPQQRDTLESGFHVTAADLAATGLAAAAAVSALRNRRRLPRRVCVLALPAVAVALATLTSADVMGSLPGFVRYLQIFVVVPLAVVIAVRDETDRRLVAGAVLAAAGVQALLGTWQAYSGTGAAYGSENIRAVGTFGAVDVMGMATIVSYGTILVLAVLLTARGRWKAAAAVPLAVMAAALVLSLSRGAWLACCVAALVMVLLSGWRKVLATAFAGVVVVALVLGTGWGSATLKQRVASIAAVSSQPDQSVSDRYGLWETAVAMWKDHPLLGVGPRGFAAYRDTYAPLQVSAGSDTDDPVNGFQRQELRSPHNMYLLVLSEQGLVGLSAFCLLWGALIVWTIRRGRKAALVAAGFLAWQLTDFGYADIGGAPTVVMSVMLGLVVSWAITHDEVSAA